MPKKLAANFVKLVTLLNDGERHDGETIGEKLKITRSAIWKLVKKLESYGVLIEAIKGKGYLLLESLILLEPKRIKQALVENKVSIEVFESIDSTADHLKSLPRSSEVKVCLAEHQTKGRGRLSREWHSPFGKNVYFSMQYRFEKDISELSGLSLVVGLAIRKTLADFKVGDQFRVKWPNDIVYDGKKLAGILIDIQAESHGVCDALISTGINVNMKQDVQAITQPWTSLINILGHAVDRNILVAKLINYLIQYIQKFEQRGLEAFMEEWLAVDALLEKKITIDNFKQKISGIVKGINSKGHLLLQLPDGKTQAFSSGDVTIVKNA